MGSARRPIRTPQDAPVWVVGLVDQINTALARLGSVHLPSYTTANVPFSRRSGDLIIVSDDAGGAALAYSDGSGNWRRSTDKTTI
jgi:hypothetical protein